MKDDSAVLWVAACVKGDHRKVASALPLDLAVCFKQATQYRVNLKTSANFNELDGKSNTSFDFAQPVDEGYDGQPEKILEWYKDTIMAAHKFGAERCM